MKKFIAYGDSTKIFSDEKDLIKYLIKEKSKKIYINGKIISKSERIKVDIVNIDILDTTIGSKYLESHIENNKRQAKINSTLGDDTYEKLDKFKSMFLEFAKEDLNKTKFLESLETVPIEKKELSKFISKCDNYLFFVDNSVEWFRSILDIHNFRKIENSYVRELFDSIGVSRYVNMVISDSTKENFERAKSIG